jgi:hypothetical protein
MKSMSVVVLFAAACGATDNSSATVEELSAALPTEAWVAMSPAVSGAAAVASPVCATLGASEFGVLTHQVASNADGVLSGVLDEVQAITMTPPTATAPGQAAWGPISSPTAAVYRLNVAESAPTEFQFVLAGSDPPGAFSDVFAGVTFTPDATHRTGQIAVDFGVMHALDSSVDPVAGQVTLHFDVNGAARNVNATFVGILGKSATQPENAGYALVTAADNSSSFAYSTNVDFTGDGIADELAHIDSQWTPTGAGVAHLTVTGGSLGTRMVTAVECWDASLSRVYYTDDASMHPTVGDPACCPD